MVTAGPTREPIDPVRYISNRSSGRMGYAVARALQRAGAEVLLISGPVALDPPAGVECVQVTSAQEMHDAVHARLANTDIFIGCAAVADYRPTSAAQQKIKRTADERQLALEACPDILAGVAALEAAPFTVGFAAETNDLRANALAKLERKRVDMIAANEVGDGIAFDQDTNALHVFWRGGEQELAQGPKAALAEALVELIAERFDAARVSGQSSRVS
jgi:phosphopantothenoylcysteine decarboxylase/phosphopantothenate--cysteine ligase